jgi:hypothetical protein
MSAMKKEKRLTKLAMTQLQDGKENSKSNIATTPIENYEPRKHN